MKKTDVPFNLDLLLLNESHVRFMRPVTALAAFVGSTKNFHPDGLYSTEIFGIPGTEARFNKRSYLDLKVKIIHPVIYRALDNVKTLYREVILGKAFARWDKDSQDLVKSDMVDGNTGFDFFCEYLPRISFPNNESESRQMAVELLEKYRKNYFVRYIGVFPAGMRDYVIEEDGQESASEFNDFYYRLLAIANNINPKTMDIAPESYNSQRASMQKALDELYQAIYSVIDGKNNMLMGKVASRRVMAGTRNVVSAMSEPMLDLHSDTALTINHTLIGLHQMAKSIIFVTLDRLKNGWIGECFATSNSPVRLCDQKTRKSAMYWLRPKSYAQWTGSEGLEQLVTGFKEESSRHLPIKIEEKFLGLVYEDFDKGIFSFVHGIEELPDDADPEKCRPITMTDLLYRSIYPVCNKYVGLATRYPITGIGSIYPSYGYVKTTIVSRQMLELDAQTWKPIDGNPVALSYPLHNTAMFNAMSPHPWKLERTGGDFDGDMFNWTALMADESLSEMKRFFSTPASVIGNDGRLIDSMVTDTIVFVLENMTFQPKDKLTADTIGEYNLKLRQSQ